jgi:hypothetical protein
MVFLMFLQHARTSADVQAQKVKTGAENISSAA